MKITKPNYERMLKDMMTIFDILPIWQKIQFKHSAIDEHIKIGWYLWRTVQRERSKLDKDYDLRIELYPDNCNDRHIATAFKKIIKIIFNNERKAL